MKDIAAGNVTLSPSSTDDVITVDQIVLAVLGGAVSVVAIILNVVVLVTIARTPSLRRLPNTLISSLAVADLLRSTAVGSIFVARLIVVVPTTDDSGGSADEEAAVWCAVGRSLTTGLEVLVIYHAALIAVERAFLIGRPLTYQCVVTPVKMAVVVVSIWILCALYAGLQNLGFADEIIVYFK